MKHTYKEKIQILRSILIEYSKYFKYFSSVKVYDLGLRFWIVFKDYKPKQTGNGSLIRKIPRCDIDIIISRYRSKLDYEIKKHNQTKNTIAKSYNFIYSIINLK